MFLVWNKNSFIFLFKYSLVNSSVKDYLKSNSIIFIIHSYK